MVGYNLRNRNKNRPNRTNFEIIHDVFGLSNGLTDSQEFAINDDVLRFKGYEIKVLNIMAHHLLSRGRRLKRRTKRLDSIWQKDIGKSKRNILILRPRKKTIFKSVSTQTIDENVSVKKISKSFQVPDVSTVPQSSDTGFFQSRQSNLLGRKRNTIHQTVSAYDFERRNHEADIPVIEQSQNSFEVDVAIPKLFQRYVHSHNNTKAEIRRTVSLKLPQCASHSNTRFDNRLFRKFCGPFLNGKCSKTNCASSHATPSWKQLLEILNKLSSSAVIIEYNAIMKRIPNVFKQYLPAFTSYFGTNGYRWQLKNMISDCEHPLRMMSINFYHIVVGFCQSGLSYVDALKELLVNMKTNNLEVCRGVMMLILDNEPANVVLFVDHIIMLACERKCSLDIEMIRKLITIANEVPNVKLITTVWSILKVNQTIMKTLKGENEYQIFRNMSLRVPPIE